jgi:hypothetical protein
MGDVRTLQNLIDDARGLTDNTAGGSLDWLTDGLLTTWANQAITDLRDRIIMEFGDDYFATNSAPLTTASGVAAYSLPADFYKLLGVDVSFDAVNNANPDNMKWLTCMRFEFAERNRWQTQLVNIWSIYALPHYRLNGSNLLFLPVSDGAHAYRVWYVPTITRLVATSDTFDFIHGWDEFVTLSMAVKVKLKDEIDVTAEMATKTSVLERIMGAIRMRDIGAPARVQDTARRSGSRAAWRDDFDEYY